MSEREEKLSKNKTPQAIVQADKVGFYPFNSLAVTALAHQQADCIIDFRESPHTPAVRHQTQWKLHDQPIDIAGRTSTGISDAFYRGRLPELLIVTTGMADVPLFVEELMDYLDKLCGLGFLDAPAAQELSVLDQYVPQVALAAYGMVFDVVYDKLKAAINQLIILSPRQKERLLQKVSRAVWTTPPDSYGPSLPPVQLFPEPLSLALAGTKSVYLLRTMQLLESHQIAHHYNPNGQLGIYELELTMGYQHLINRIVPALANAPNASSASIQTLTQAWETMCREMGILPGTTTTQSLKAAKTAPEPLTMVDLAMLHQLIALAQRTDSHDLCDILKNLLTIVKEALITLHPATGKDAVAS